MIPLLAGAILAHSFYHPSWCCNETDCRPVPCAEIRYSNDHVSWRGLRGTLWSTYPSPDAACHICSSNISLRCVFIPEATS